MIKHDGTIDLAVGMHVNSKIWKNQKTKWSDLVKRLREENKTNETFKEYVSATKEERLKIKDVGGYVGGYLQNGIRKPGNVKYRQLMTLDIDFAHKDFWSDYSLQFDNAAVLHATHSHNESSPRYRLIIPLSRPCTPDEYVAVSRKVAGLLGIDFFDNTTFETNRLMFWPSNPKDIDYYFEYQDGPWIDVDEILSSYSDWTNTQLWPTADKSLNEVKDSALKQQDPEDKKGIVGAFCRTYSITDVMEKFLSGVYLPTGMDDRYTYSKGSAAGGLLVYDDKFAFSHHGTDPVSGKLCNAFDLVRIHLFGHLDEDSKYKGSKPKSYIAMAETARSDSNVKKTIATQNIKDAKYDFVEDLEENEAVEDDDIDWMRELEVDTKGTYLSTSPNLNLIFTNDHRMKKLFRQNDFDGKRYVFGNLPWRKIPKPEPVRNVDYSGVRNYIESIYGINGAMKVEDSLSLEFEKNHFHPVIEYLSTIEWDGVERLDSLLIDFFGAADNIYTREAIRKMFVGAVARVFNPGVKFDLVLTLVSTRQGTGKSSFLKAIGGDWFSDTFITVQGKEAFEQLQGSWIIEMAELSGLRKADIEATKHFISKQEDIFRPAYARTSETFPRQCVFVATTNESTFLRDPSGNRRFLPVPIHNVRLTDNPELKSFINDQDLIDQYWAEAVHKYRQGETLYLSSDAEKIANIEQKLHSETDERKGLIEDYLERRLPEDWDELDIFERRSFLEDPLSERGTVTRMFVSVAEIWCECLSKSKEDMDRYKTREINDILRSLEDWDQVNSTRNFKIYGKQKYYSRKI